MNALGWGMAYELKGKVKLVMEPMTFGSGFTKREFVVTVEDGKFPQDICFETVKDKTTMLDGLSEGEMVTVSFDIRGREYNGRYFNNLQAWKVTRGGGGGGGGGGYEQQGAPSYQASSGRGAAGFPIPDESENPEYDEDPF
jgi:single-strand DNA-binding protein